MSQSETKATKPIRDAAWAGNNALFKIAIESGAGVVRIETNTGTGNGILINVFGKTKILTNAHVVGGATEISGIFYPKSFELVSPLDTIPILDWQEISWKFPLRMEKIWQPEDLALLSFANPISPDLLPTLKWVASLQLEISCKEEKQSSPCVAKAEIFAGESTAFQSQISVVSRDFGSVVHVINSLDALIKPANVFDFYISGLYETVDMLNIYARRGVSGAPYYMKNTFAGMISIINQGFESTVYGIPATEIAKVLARDLSIPNNFQPSEAILSCRGLWNSFTESGLFVPGRESAGGPNGSGPFAPEEEGEGDERGGGDNGSGGAKTQARPEDAQWLLQNISTQSMWSGKGNEFFTENPFLATSQSFKIGELPIAYFVWGKGNILANDHYMAPSIARQCYLDINETGKWQPVEMKEANWEKMSERRAEKSNPMQWLRIWREVDKGVFTNHAPTGGNFHDGLYSLWMPKNAQVQSSPELLVDTLSDPFNIYMGNHPDYSLILYIKKENLMIQVKKDFGQIIVKRIENITDPTRAFVAVIADLRRVPIVDATKYRYENAVPNEDYPARAVLFFDDDNLMQAERILVQVKDKLLEISYCNPRNGYDCWKGK